jgi:hypothetical protein
VSCHATALPGRFVAIRRYVATLPGTYADYITQFAPKGTTPTSATSGRVITLVADAESGVLLPKHLRYPRAGGGRTVRLAGTVRATLSSAGSLVGVTWRFSSRGTPSYLSGVVSVSLTGHDVPKRTVLAVARRVRPV